MGIMKVSRGRLGQYRLLRSEDTLANHLLETDRFSKESLNLFIEKYKSIMIKPTFGPGKVCISLLNGYFQIYANQKITTFSDIESLYEHLIQHELKQPYYIIQPMKTRPRFYRSPYQVFVTYHRNSPTAEWHFMSKTKEDHTLLGSLFYLLFHQKLKSISRIAANKLGNAYPTCHTIVIDLLYDLKGNIWIQDTTLHFPISKWSQFQTLTAHQPIATFVPETNLFTKVTFKHFLNKYKKVFLKPSVGQEGKGIIQVATKNLLNYEIHAGEKKVTYSNLDKTYRYIKDHYLSKKDYLVQQKIPLAKINNTPMDIRVIVQKQHSNWLITGKLVKFADSGFIVTNPEDNLLPFKVGVKSSNIPKGRLKKLESNINSICLAAAKKLEENKPGISIIGFDIGVTNKGRIWIIEGNYIPDLYMFYLLEDKTNYLNILENKKE